MAIVHSMDCVYVRNEEEILAAIEAKDKEGKRMAACSNTGCPEGVLRLVFLPKSAFKNV